MGIGTCENHAGPYLWALLFPNQNNVKRAGKITCEYMLNLYTQIDTKLISFRDVNPMNDEISYLIRSYLWTAWIGGPSLMPYAHTCFMYHVSFFFHSYKLSDL